MDAIQTYRGHPAAPSPQRPTHPATALPVNPAAAKVASDYLRALRRRIWMVLAVAVPLAVLGCLYALRMPPVYLVKAEIEIAVIELARIGIYVEPTSAQASAAYAKLLAAEQIKLGETVVLVLTVSLPSSLLIHGNPPDGPGTDLTIILTSTAAETNVGRAAVTAQ